MSIEFILQQWPWWVTPLGILISLVIYKYNRGAKMRGVLISALSLGGLAMLADLLYVKFTNTSGVCDLSETVSCSAVNTSEFSEVLGIPIALFGIAYFLVAIFFALRKQEADKNMGVLFLITLLALIPGIYLSLIEHFVINIICPFCEASKMLMVGIMFLAWPAAKRSGLIQQRAVIGVVLLGIIGSGFTYMIQLKTSGTGDDHTKLVQCLLEEKNVQMYGSFKCASCARQRRILGEDLFEEFALEIECHPDGENAQLRLCLDKGIEKTPTWLQEDENGNVLQRIEGYQTPGELADLFGCGEYIEN